MTKDEKIERLAAALNAINNAIYGQSVVLGSPTYYFIRHQAVNALTDCGEKVK